MRPSQEMAERLKNMLTHDKIGVKEGFVNALNGDLNRVLGDYFDLPSPVSAEVSLNDEGGYDIKITACASRIKRFETTADLPRR